MIIDVSPQVQELGEGGHSQPDRMGKQHGNGETGTWGERNYCPQYQCQRPHRVQDHHHMRDSIITIAIACVGIFVSNQYQLLPTTEAN